MLFPTNPLNGPPLPSFIFLSLALLELFYSDYINPQKLNSQPPHSSENTSNPKSNGSSPAKPWDQCSIFIFFPRQLFYSSNRIRRSSSILPSYPFLLFPDWTFILHQGYFHISSLSSLHLDLTAEHIQSPALHWLLRPSLLRVCLLCSNNLSPTSLSLLNCQFTLTMCCKAQHISSPRAFYHCIYHHGPEPHASLTQPEQCFSLFFSKRI